jgi:hypothetical protein
LLFAYPIVAAEENWLHECLSAVIREATVRMDAGEPVESWPQCIPAERRGRLRNFRQLEERLAVLLQGYRGLSPQARALVREALEDQAALDELFAGQRSALVASRLPKAVRDPAKRFFDKAFTVLADVGIRDSNYRKFTEAVEDRICAFCGCEYFSGAGHKREPLDHYLALSLYPFAGANSNNLVPMGPRCNSSYKLSKDVLRDRSGIRRKCFNPYTAEPVRVSLLRSRLFARDGSLPEWEIDLYGDPERIETWNDVFDVEARFADHLDPIYKKSLKVFGALWHKNRAVLGEGANVCGAFRHLMILSRAEGWSGRAFLKTALYDLLYSRCSAGGHEAERIAAEYTTTL